MLDNYYVNTSNGKVVVKNNCVPPKTLFEKITHHFNYYNEDDGEESLSHCGQYYVYCGEELNCLGIKFGKNFYITRSGLFKTFRNHPSGFLDRVRITDDGPKEGIVEYTGKCYCAYQNLFYQYSDRKTVDDLFSTKIKF